MTDRASSELSVYTLHPSLEKEASHIGISITKIKICAAFIESNGSFPCAYM